MLNIDSLITTYSWMLETLKEIRKKEQELLSFDSVKQELKKVQKENQELKDQIKWNKKHINILSRTLWEKICTDCWWEWWFEWYEWDWWPCEECSTTWLIKI